MFLNTKTLTSTKASGVVFGLHRGKKVTVPTHNMYMTTHEEYSSFSRFSALVLAADPEPTHCLNAAADPDGFHIPE